MSDTNQRPHDRYVVVGDFGSPFGWVIDWNLYMSFRWLKRAFGNGKSEATIASGTRVEMRELAHEMNLLELKKQNTEV